MIDSKLPGDIVVIGVGNPFRRDDGVGPAVADRLRAQRLPGVRLAVTDGDPATLIDLWDGARLAVVVDAVLAEPTTPGRVHRFSVVESPPRRPRAPSPHAVDSPATDLGDAVELARVLDRLPRRLVLFVVEAGDVDFGAGLTSAVAAAAGRVAATIVNEVELAAA